MGESPNLLTEKGEKPSSNSKNLQSNPGKSVGCLFASIDIRGQVGARVGAKGHFKLPQAGGWFVWKN